MFCISSVDAYGIISVLHNVSNFRQSVSFKACANYDHAKFLVGRHIICFDTHGICFNFKYAISEAIKILSFYAKLIHQNILQCYKNGWNISSLANPGRGTRDVRPLAVPFLLFSCSFQETIGQIIGWPHLFGVGASRLENPVSATAYVWRILITMSQA